MLTISQGSQANRIPTIVERSEQALSTWVRLVTKVVRDSDSQEHVFHLIGQQDYVSILAMTEDDKFVFVRQYRPALEQVTLELPSGLREPDEQPDATAIRELQEETGFAPVEPVRLLGRLHPDTGRLENSMWCFAAPVVRRADGWRPERGVETVLLNAEEIHSSIRSGAFVHALHIAVLQLALIDGLFPRLVPAPLGSHSGSDGE